MINKRKSPRRDTVLYLPIVDAESGNQIGRMADISQTGILIVADSALPEGRRIQARILLPPHLADLSAELAVEIEPRWSRPDKNPQLVLNGCFLVVDESDAETVSALIERYGFNNDTIDFRRRYEQTKYARDEEA